MAGVSAEDMPRCEVCGAVAAVHIVQIRDGQKTEQHLCTGHGAVMVSTSGRAPWVNWSLLLGGALLMMFAVSCCLVTMVESRSRQNPYTSVLTLALILMSAADLCFLSLFIRGGWVWRGVAVVASLPSLFVIDEFLRRA
jgi:hypothetical protein